MGVLISLEEATTAMRREAASAGFYKSHWGQHPRLQLRTVAELPGGAEIDAPPSNVTFRRAPKAETAEMNLSLLDPAVSFPGADEHGLEDSLDADAQTDPIVESAPAPASYRRRKKRR